MDLRKGITSFIVVMVIVAGLLVFIVSNMTLQSKLVESNQVIFLEMKTKQVKKDILHSFESTVYLTLSNQLVTEPDFEQVALVEKILHLEQVLEEKYSGAVEVDLWVKKQGDISYFSSESVEILNTSTTTGDQRQPIKKSDLEKIIAVKNHTLKSYVLAFVDKEALAEKLIELAEEKKLLNPVAQEFILAEHNGLVLGATITASSNGFIFVKTVLFPTGYTLVVKKTELQLIEEMIF